MFRICLRLLSVVLLFGVCDLYAGIDRWELTEGFSKIQTASDAAQPWSVGWVPCEDWTGRFDPADRLDTRVWKRGDQWLAWPTASDYVPAGIHLNALTDRDGVVAFRAPRSGRYRVTGWGWRNGKIGAGSPRDDGVVFSIQSSALVGQTLVLWREIIGGDQKKPFDLPVTLARGQTVLFRNSKGTWEDYDNHTVLNVSVALTEGLPEATAREDSRRLTKPLILGDSISRLTLSPAGRIEEIRDLLTHARVAWSADPSIPAWKIRCASGETITSAQYPAPRVTGKNEEVCFIWEARDFPKVTGRVRFDSRKGEFLISTALDEVGKRNIAELEYPTGLTVSAAGGNYLVAAGSWADETAARLHELNTIKSELALMYPGIMHMQMIGFKLGSSALLVYTNDTESKIKWHYFKPNKGELEHRLVHIPRLAAGREPWQEPYAAVYKVISYGGYNELAHGYAEWARGQTWARVKVADKVKRCSLLKRYIEDGCIRMHIPSESRYTFGKDNRWHYQKPSGDKPVYETTLAMMDRFEKTTGCQPGYWWPTWAGHQFDTAYPDYFPVAEYMGDFDRFKETMIRTGRPIMYHMNMAHWVTYRPSYRKDWMATWGGRDWPCTWYQTAHTYVSPDLTLLREMQNIHRIADTAGVNGPYLDVLGAVFLEDDNPRSRFAKTPNSWQLARNQTFREVRKKVTGPIMTESRSESYLASVDFDFGYVGGPQDDPVPLWQLVYGDCVLLMPYVDKHGFPSYINLACTYGGILEVPFDPEYAWLSWMQRVLSQVVGRRMVRYDRIGEYRVSQWDTGSVVWRRPVPGDDRPKDSSFSTVAGGISIEGQRPDGLLVWTADQDFIAYGLGEFKINDVKLFHSDSPELRFIRYRDTLLVHNPTSREIQARCILYDQTGREYPIVCHLKPQASEKILLPR